MPQATLPENLQEQLQASASQAKADEKKRQDKIGKLHVYSDMHGAHRVDFFRLFRIIHSSSPSPVPSDSFREVLPHKLGAARRLVLQRVMQYTSHMRTLVRMHDVPLSPQPRTPSLASVRLLVLFPPRRLIGSDLDCLLLLSAEQAAIPQPECDPVCLRGNYGGSHVTTTFMVASFPSLVLLLFRCPGLPVGPARLVARRSALLERRGTGYDQGRPGAPAQDCHIGGYYLKVEHEWNFLASEALCCLGSTVRPWRR